MVTSYYVIFKNVEIFTQIFFLKKELILLNEKFFKCFEIFKYIYRYIYYFILFFILNLQNEIIIHCWNLELGKVLWYLK
jgi:hypothetical protein